MLFFCAQAKNKNITNQKPTEIKGRRTKNTKTIQNVTKMSKTLNILQKPYFRSQNVKVLEITSFQAIYLSS